MTVLLVGTTNASTTNEATGYVVWDKFVAGATGACTEVHVYTQVDGHVKVAVHADSGGSPGARLAKQDTSTTVLKGGGTGQWNTVTLEASCSIVSGTTYHVGHVLDTQGSVTADSTGGVSRYYYALPGTYAAWTWPDPAGATTPQANYLTSISGYGTTGWAHIAKVHGVASASIAKINGVLVANISKIDGTAV